MPLFAGMRPSAPVGGQLAGVDSARAAIDHRLALGTGVLGEAAKSTYAARRCRLILLFGIGGG
jgi:hypothetical protein